MSLPEATILVMDDDDAVRLSFSDYLEDLGYHILTAENGRIGVEIFEKEKVDLVMLDLRMPEMNGLEVLSHLKAKSPDTPLIVVSGTGVIHDAVEALHKGAWDYILKPIDDLSILDHAIENALEKMSLRRENRQYQYRLEQMVEERTFALEKAQQQVIRSQKMEAIGTLAGGVAHDFNNILSAVIGYAEIALDDELPTDALARNSLENILKAGLRARDLVKQILAFSRQAQYEKKPMAVEPIAKEVMKLLRASLPSTIEIKLDVSVSCSNILGDPAQIHQVIMNLCTNAGYAMRKNGGVLGVKLSAVEYGPSDMQKPADLKAGSYILLAVTDTGRGMTPAVLDRILDPFFTTKPKEEGTGLGLSVVHGIVKEHGGSIQVDSRKGEGSKFFVYLPMLVDLQKDEPVVDKQLPLGDERILVVDDEETVAELTKLILQGLGYTVTAVSKSQEALSMLSDHPEKYDLVLTDQTMPEMTGNQLAEKILRIRPQMPIVLCTGFSHLINEANAKKIGIRDFVMKPVVRKDLAITVRHVLDQNRIQ